MRTKRSQPLLLVVDDSPTGRRVVSEALRSRGYEVITAEDGEQALDLALRRKPELIVLDVVLPKKNGFQVCRQIKSELYTRGIKVVLLTSKALDTDKQWGLQQGADGFVTKPVEMSRLLRTIDDALAIDDEPEAEPPTACALGVPALSAAI